MDLELGCPARQFGIGWGETRGEMRRQMGRRSMDEGGSGSVQQQPAERGSRLAEPGSGTKFDDERIEQVGSQRLDDMPGAGGLFMCRALG